MYQEVKDKTQLYKENEAYLKSLDDAQKIVWGKSYHWDIKFVEPDGKALGPFKDWLPASSVSINLFNTQDKDFSIGGNQYSIPLTHRERQITLSLYDDINCTIEKFFISWINSMWPSPTTVATLDSIVKLLYIARLNNQKEAVRTTGYWVRPTGNSNLKLSSESSARVLDIVLKIVGTIPEK